MLSRKENELLRTVDFFGIYCAIIKRTFYMSDFTTPGVIPFSDACSPCRYPVCC